MGTTHRKKKKTQQNYKVVQVLATMGVTHRKKQRTTTELQSSSSFSNYGYNP